MINKRNTRRTTIATIFLSAALMLTGCKTQNDGTALFTKTALHSVRNKRQLTKLITPKNERNGWRNFDANVGEMVPEAGEADSSTSERDYVDTNVQVSGVDEADIIKTDGHEIYYMPRYSNTLNVFTVKEDYKVALKHQVSVENMAFDSMYLLDDYVVALGYSTMYTNGPSYGLDYYYYRYYENTVVTVYTRSDMAKVYELELDSRAISHRLIGRSLFLVTHKNIYVEGDADVRPHYTINEEDKSAVTYSDIYYFDETPALGFTLVSGLYLHSEVDEIVFNTDAYLGSNYGYKQLYVSNENLYITDTNYIYTRGNSFQTMTISSFALDPLNATATYLAAGIVLGGMLNQFAMDEYDGYLRVATVNRHATWIERLNGNYENYESKITNYLFILKINKSAKLLTLTSYIKEGLGKPGESIKSVRFDREKAYIVTFLQMDPLYVINLSDPENPVITDEVELPGFDVYQHVWGDDLLLGFGYDADDFGVTTGMKLTAYDVSEGEARELETYKLNDKATIDNTVWHYSYSEALYNHKAMLVSPKHGIFGFPTSSYTWSASNENMSAKYTSSYNIFKIDFNAEQIIAAPIVIEHATSTEVYGYTDRAVLIDDYIFTFSSNAIITYDFVNDMIFAEFSLS